jgi:excinuclease ABC subunit C
VVDGGKGQLNIAVAIFKELQIFDGIDIVGIAKKDEKKGEAEDKVYKPGRANPVAFGRERELLLFLQRIRDEAHRFAISFHRKRRTKRSMRSALDTIPGIGKKRKELLLKHFGSVRNIRTATIEDIRALPGITDTVAEVVKKRLDV